ncbi:MAG: RNA-binding protein, partial [Thermosynechococcaceae cyanobacterium]
MSIRLYVGNLPKELERKELETLFSEAAGEPASTKIVTDRKTGRCRGFGFVTVATDEQADLVIEKLNGQVFKDSTLKIEKALPKAKETTNGATEPSAAAGSVNKRSKGKGR